MHIIIIYMSEWVYMYIWKNIIDYDIISSSALNAVLSHAYHYYLHA